MSSGPMRQGPGAESQQGESRPSWVDSPAWGQGENQSQGAAGIKSQQTKDSRHVPDGLPGQKDALLIYQSQTEEPAWGG